MMTASTLLDWMQDLGEKHGFLSPDDDTAPSGGGAGETEPAEPPAAEAPAAEPAEAPPGVELKLGAIKLTGISQGGYEIGFTGDVPEGYTALFAVGGDQQTLDITKGYDSGKLTDLLDAIDAANAWGTQADCYVTLAKGGKVTGPKSNVVKLTCPVAPHAGGLGLDALGKSEYVYCGNGHGRILSTSIGGKYYFKYGGKFETDPKMRGFDCISYVGSAYGMQGSMNAYGSQLAQAMGASEVDMEAKMKDEIVPFFTTGDGKSGTYIMFTERHVVVVKGGSVYEFSESKKGFAKTAAASWGYANLPHWIRKI